MSSLRFPLAWAVLRSHDEETSVSLSTRPRTPIHATWAWDEDQRRAYLGIPRALAWTGVFR
jgi:hypothetical protein